MLLRAMAAGSVILFVMTRAETVTGILVLRTVQGFLTGTVTAATTLVAMGTPNEKTASALGTLASSTFIGFSLGPFFGGYAAQWLGYRSSFLIGSTLLAVGFVLVFFLVVEPHGDSGATDSAGDGPVDSGRDSAIPARSGAESATVAFNWRAIVPYLSLVFFLRITRSLAMPFIPLHIQELRGGAEGVAAAVGAIQGLIGLVSAIAGVTLARLGDRFPRIRVIAVCASFSMILIAPTAFAGSIAVFTAFFVAGAFFLGGIEPNVQSEISRLVPANRRGLIFGILTMVGSAGWAIAPLTGSAVGIRYGTAAVFIAMTVVLALLVIVSLVLQRNQVTKGRGGGVPRIK